MVTHGSLSSRVLMYSFLAPTYSGLDVISVVEMKCAVVWVFTVGSLLSGGEVVGIYVQRPSAADFIIVTFSHTL